MCESCYKEEQTKIKCPITKKQHWLIHEPYSFAEIEKKISVTTTFAEAVDLCFTLHKNRPYLGIISDCKTKFNWRTYGEHRLQILVIIKKTLFFFFFKY